MSDSAQIKEALRSPDTSTTLLNAILLSRYGEDVYTWDPLTVYLELKSDFRVNPCSEVMDRIGSLQVIMTTDAFFKRLDAFIAICNTLSSGDPYFMAFDPATSEEAAWGIAEVSLLRDVLPFSYAIKQYLSQVLAEDGYSSNNYPEPINLVFSDEVTSEKIKTAIKSGDDNKNIVEQYIDEQLLGIVQEFDRIPSLSGYERNIFKADQVDEREYAI